jgi:uncharacterized protein YgbK (DUF1537 family)
MTIRIAAIADDYTGASDLANTWRKNGLRTVQTIGIPSAADFAEVDAVVVSLKIRSAPAEAAVSAALAANAFLRDHGAPHVSHMPVLRPSPDQLIESDAGMETAAGFAGERA